MRKRAAAAVRCRRRRGRDAHGRPRRRERRRTARAQPPGREARLEEVRHHQLPDAPVRVPEGAARPRATRAGEQITLALSRVPHTAKTYQGPLLVNPGGPGGSGLTLAGFVASVAAEGGGGPVRRHRLRPARGGREQARPELQAGPLRPGAPGLRAEHPGDREGQPRRAPGPSPRPAARSTRSVLPYIDTRQRRAGHGRDPRGPRRPEDQLLRLLVRHLPGRGVRQAVPAAGAAPGPGLDRRPDRRLVRGQPRARTTPSTTATGR